MWLCGDDRPSFRRRRPLSSSAPPKSERRPRHRERDRDFASTSHLPPVFFILSENGFAVHGNFTHRPFFHRSRHARCSARLTNLRTRVLATSLPDVRVCRRQRAPPAILPRVRVATGEWLRPRGQGHGACSTRHWCRLNDTRRAGVRLPLRINSEAPHRSDHPVGAQPRDAVGGSTQRRTVDAQPVGPSACGSVESVPRTTDCH